MSPKGGLSILDALDNLNTLVDADTLDEVEITEELKLALHKREEKELYWTHIGPDDQSIQVLKDTFQAVFNYLQVFYVSMKKTGDTKKLVEGVNTIMVLVGEAGQKLDRYQTLFNKKVSEFPEYQQLQNFYQKRVIPESFKAFSKIPVLQNKSEVLPEQEEWEREIQKLLSEESDIEEATGVHILNDLDIIKRDHLYELFCLKNEDGHPFYTLDLARNIKLACDFGVFFNEYFGEDPLLKVKNWEDKQLNISAGHILSVIRRPLEKFCAEAMHYKQMEMVYLLQYSCMALMLAANPRNLIRQFSLKGCHRYFFDFLLLLREVLHHRDFEKLMTYGSPSGNIFFQNVLNLVNGMCRALFTQSIDMSEIQKAIEDEVEKLGTGKKQQLSETLLLTNHALQEVFKRHPNGPIFKALDIVRENEFHAFDSFLQGNLPSIEWKWQYKQKDLQVLHLACPVIQERINYAEILEEFKIFLRGLSLGEHLLVINYQDRTSWKEHARCIAIEECARHGEFAPFLTVVTLSVDTDFYNQTGIYANLFDAQEFIEQFIDHLGDEATGYYFPSHVKNRLFPQFIEGLMRNIHEHFFEKKETLSFLERIDFIELAYHFIELKLIECVGATFLALSSKDALDIGAVASVGLMALISLSKGQKLDGQKVQALLFAPTLMQRERVIHPEKLERLCSMIQLLEKTKGDYLQKFGLLYEKTTLNGGVIL